MEKLPTPEQLGEMLKTGRITEGEAAEIMAERARAEAFRGLYANPGAGEDGEPQDGTGAGSSRRLAVVALIVAVVALTLLFLLTRLLP